MEAIFAREGSGGKEETEQKRALYSTGEAMYSIGRSSISDMEVKFARESWGKRKKRT